MPMTCQAYGSAGGMDMAVLLVMVLFAFELTRLGTGFGKRKEFRGGKWRGV